MERGFMGLSSKQPLLVNEVVDENGFKETGYSKSSAVEWPCSDKDVKMFPISNQGASASAINGFFRYPFVTSAQNSTGTNSKPLLLGGIPSIKPLSVILPIMNSFAGFAEPRKDAGSLGFPQLTIFYKDQVNVFDEISPEKAQAIMSMASQKVQARETDSTAVSVSSNSATQWRRRTIGTENPVVANTTHVVGSFCAYTMIPSVPQARKASLARFLEKRKERLMNAAPYKVGKKFLECETGESSGMNYCFAASAP